MLKSITKSPFSRWLLGLGPGIITAALVFGSSKITITSKLGATLFFAKANLNDLASGFIPSVPVGSKGLIVSFMASCFSMCRQSYVTPFLYV